MIRFTVFGIPVPQGSASAFIVKGHGVVPDRASLHTSNRKLHPWRQQLSWTALAAMKDLGEAVIARTQAVRVEAEFYFEKPKSTKKSVQMKVTKPDVDKLGRALLDGLTGIVFEDDAQVTDCWIGKRFGSPARVEVRVSELEFRDIVPFSAVGE